MKQIIQSYRTGEVWLADVPAPAMRGCGAIVQTRASLVSAGTERMILELAKKSLFGKARARPDLVRKVIAKIKSEGIGPALEKTFAKLDMPIALGYSCAGAVLEAEHASGFHPGDRVACGGAEYATHAEVNFVPKNLLARIPDNVSFEDASFTTVGAIAMQGVRQADVRLGERVVVIGLGLIGLLTVQILQAAGCRVLGSDPDSTRREIARSFGAEVTPADDLIEAAAGFSDGTGVDAVLITAATKSNQPIEQAAEICRAKGRVVVIGSVGMDVPREPFYKKELDLRLSMSYGPGRYDPQYEEGGHDYPIAHVRWTEQRNMANFLDLIAAGKVTPSRFISHRFEIDRALEAYELLASGDPSLGILIDYPHREQAISRTIELRDVYKTGQIGIGFIGAGNFARGVLLPTLKKIGGIGLIGVCTASGASSLQTAKAHQFAYATTDPKQLLNDPNVNVIFIATRHDSHGKLGCEALNADKHVFVEKPLCIKPCELEKCEQAVAAHSDRCLMVGFNRRFSPHTKEVVDYFADRSGPMVISYRVNAGAIAKGTWISDDQIGGGRIIGELCHFIDWCEHVSGSIPVHVMAEGAGENVMTTIRYRDGSVATIQYVTVGPTELGKERIEIFADGRAVVLDDFTCTTFIGEKRPAIKTRQDKGFTGELTAFLDSIRSGGKPPIAIDSLFRTTRVTFAVLESLRIGKSVQIA